MTDNVENNLLPNSTPGPSINEATVAGHTTIPVVEEQIRVDKQVIETGKVRITKTVHQEKQEVDLPLLREGFTVERVPVNEYVDAPPLVRTEGDTTVYPVLKEVLVIEKKLVLVEEVRVTRQQSTTHDPQQVMLRREEITVDRIPNQSERSV